MKGSVSYKSIQMSLVFKKYEIDIKVNKEVFPKVQRQRSVPAPLESRLKQEIERMIHKDVIEEERASWDSPVHIVSKEMVS